MLEADVEVDRRDFAVRASLQVAPGERLALFGPSGAGKTTLLEAIAGLVTPRRARITLGGRVLTATGRSPAASPPGASTGQPAVAVPPWRRGVGLLRQDPGLFPHLSVRDNLRYTRPVPEAELAELATALGIDGLLAAMPARLSGGQAHRVALGRLLLARCGALLLDEPYTGLDTSLRRTLTDLVITLVSDRAVPAILVAHELAEAQAFADRLAVLDRGNVLQSGEPADVVLRPACRRVAELVGYTAFVPLGGLAPASGPAGVEHGHAVAGVHPDRVITGRHRDLGLVLSGVVTACRPSGARWEIAMRVNAAPEGHEAQEETTVTARLPDLAPIGAPLTLTATEPPCFGPDGIAVAPSQAPWRREQPASDRPPVRT